MKTNTLCTFCSRSVKSFTEKSQQQINNMVSQVPIALLTGHVMWYYKAFYLTMSSRHSPKTDNKLGYFIIDTLINAPPIKNHRQKSHPSLVLFFHATLAYAVIKPNNFRNNHLQVCHENRVWQTTTTDWLEPARPRSLPLMILHLLVD